MAEDRKYVYDGPEDVREVMVPDCVRDCCYDDLYAGKIVTFGRYPQTAEGTDQTPIEWQILDQRSDRILLFCRYGLDARPYNNQSCSAYTASWGESTIREWLNNDFIRLAFTEEEQKCILMTETEEKKEVLSDKIFLLSMAQATQYFGVETCKKNIRAMGTPTAFAIHAGACTGKKYKTENNKTTISWWLLEPSLLIDYDGSPVMSDETTYSDVCVRPAIWIRIASESRNNISEGENIPIREKESQKEIREYVYDGPEDAEEITVPYGVTHIGAFAFEPCSKVKKVHLPDSVLVIGRAAFALCDNLESVELPDCLSVIEDDAFAGTKLSSVTIPDSVTSIGNSVFSGCMNLKSVILPKSLQIIEPYLFSNCIALTNVEIPESVKTIGSNVFSSCKELKKIKIHSSVTVIEEDAFDSAYALEEIEFFGTEKQWDDIWIKKGNLELLTAKKHFINGSYLDGQKRVFSYDGPRDISEYTVPDGITWLKDNAFKGTSITSVSMPDTVTYIGKGAFSECVHLRSITIPPQVSAIRDKTFYLSSNIEIVNIPHSIRWIGEEAFFAFLKQLNIYYDGTIDEWNSIMIDQHNLGFLNAIIHCTDGEITHF